MNDKEIKEFLALLKEERKKAAKYTKEEAADILKSVGILTENGNVANPYKDIWYIQKPA